MKGPPGLHGFLIDLSTAFHSLLFSFQAAPIDLNLLLCEIEIFKPNLILLYFKACQTQSGYNYSDVLKRFDFRKYSTIRKYVTVILSEY